MNIKENAEKRELEIEEMFKDNSFLSELENLSREMNEIISRQNNQESDALANEAEIEKIATKMQQLHKKHREDEILPFFINLQSNYNFLKKIRAITKITVF